MFSVNCYSAVLDLGRHRDALITDINKVLGESELVDHPGHQTPAVLQNLSGDHWEAYRDLMFSILDGILVQSSRRWTSRNSWSWGLVFDRPEEIPDSSDGLHAHPSATLTSVLLLAVPEEIKAPEHGGGTVLRNPLAPLRLTGSELHAVVPAQALRLLVFPGSVEHYPEPARVTAFSTPRVMLGTDVHYY